MVPSPWALAAALLLLLAGVACSGCRFVSASRPSPAPKDAAVVHIRATPAGCAPQPGHVRAGAVDFVASNLDAATVSEVEVRTANLDEVMGERENLIEGLTGQFSATLSAGRYVVDCPGALRSRWPLVATGGERGASG